MGLLLRLLGIKKKEKSDDDYYSKLYEIYYGEKPRKELTEDEKIYLEMLAAEEWDD